MSTTPCRHCESRPAAKGLLCGRCVNQLGAIGDFFPDQISATAPNQTAAYLLDPWGRSHALGASTVVTREPQQPGLRICAASISRHHALIGRRDGVFTLHDTGSRNGCSVNGVAVDGQAQLREGDTVSFSTLSFYFVVATPCSEKVYAATVEGNPDYETREPPSAAGLLNDTHDHARPAQPENRAELSTLHIYASPHAPGGMITLGDTTHSMTELQFAFIATLADRLQSDQPSPIAGFVGIDEFLTTLPWNSATAGEAQLKSLVYRVRALLSSMADAVLIERQRDLGYRLALSGTKLVWRRDP